MALGSNLKSIRAKVFSETQFICGSAVRQVLAVQFPKTSDQNYSSVRLGLSTLERVKQQMIGWMLRVIGQMWASCKPNAGPAHVNTKGSGEYRVKITTVI